MTVIAVYGVIVYSSVDAGATVRRYLKLSPVVHRRSMASWSYTAASSARALVLPRVPPRSQRVARVGVGQRRKCPCLPRNLRLGGPEGGLGLDFGLFLRSVNSYITRLRSAAPPWKKKTAESERAPHSAFGPSTRSWTVSDPRWFSACVQLVERLYVAWWCFGWTQRRTRLYVLLRPAIRPVEVRVAVATAKK